MLLFGFAAQVGLPSMLRFTYDAVEIQKSDLLYFTYAFHRAGRPTFHASVLSLPSNRFAFLIERARLRTPIQCM